jgi:hypothetical protein
MQPQVSADGRFYWDGQTWKPIPTPNASPINRVPGLVVLAGATVLVIGSFLPWITATAPFVGTITRSLMDGGSDGLFLDSVGGVVLLIGLAMTIRGPMRGISLAAILTLVVAAVIVLFDYNDLQGRVANVTSASNLIIASVGAGPYVSAFGIVIAAIGSAMALFGRGSEVPVAEPSQGQPTPPAGSQFDHMATTQLAEPTPPKEAGTKLGENSSDGAWYWNGEKWLPNS